MRYLDVSVVCVNGAWFGLVRVVIGACVGVSVSVSVCKGGVDVQRFSFCVCCAVGCWCFLSLCEGEGKVGRWGRRRTGV